MLTKSGSVIDIEGSDKAKVRTLCRPWIRVADYSLTNDKKVIEEDKCLSDIHIGAAQALLRAQFSDIKGLQSSLLQSSDLASNTSKGILQIVHTNNNHWIAISTIGCTLGTVKLYDSVYCTMLSKDTQKIIAQLFHSSLTSIHVKIMNTAKQNGTKDCGLDLL